MQFAGVSIWAALGMFTLLNRAFAGVDDLQDFVTETGKCTLTEKIELLDQFDGAGDYSYTLDSTKIYQSGVGSTGTNIPIPPLTRLNCLARNGDKMLVTAAEQTKSHCGWVEVDSLLEANAENYLAFGSDLAPCGVIQAISMRDFCAKMKEIHGVTESCALKSMGRSVLKTNFN